MKRSALKEVKWYPIRVAVSIVLLFYAVPPVAAADQTYTGDLRSRSTLTGDWGGLRNDLGRKGVTVDLNLVQIEQGVTAGGKSSKWEYGGRGDLTLKVDTGKLGLWPGGFLTAELEGSFGHGVNERTGALMPVNSNQIFPVPVSDQLCIPALNFAQFLSEYFGLLLGKFDTMSAPLNEFAQGKGDSQFMNLALNVDPVLLTTVPYSPLGGGMIILPTKDPDQATVSLMVFSAVGDANTTGFSTLDGNKLTFVGQGRVRTKFFGLTGHQLVGISYSNKEFTSLDQRFSNVVINSIAKEKGSLAFYYNFDQYFYQPEKGSGKGLGVFGRFGVSDGSPNPVHYFFSLGIGGKGMLDRARDQFGIGWYYVNVDQPSFTGPLETRQFFRNEQGVEAYYNFALAPWVLLTPDIQVVHGAQKDMVRRSPPFLREKVDTSTVLGLRLQLIF